MKYRNERAVVGACRPVARPAACSAASAGRAARCPSRRAGARGAAPASPLAGVRRGGEQDAVERAAAGVLAEVDQVVDPPHRLAEQRSCARLAGRLAPPARVSMIWKGSTDVRREHSISCSRAVSPTDRMTDRRSASSAAPSCAPTPRRSCSHASSGYDVVERLEEQSR